MRVRAPGIELERRPVVGTDSAVGRELRLERGRLQRPAQDRSARAASRSASADRSARLGARASRRDSSWSPLSTAARPIRPTAPGAAACPDGRTASRAGAGSSGARKNMRAAGARARRLAAEHTGVAHRVLEPAMSGVDMPGSSCCCSRQFSLSSAPIRAKSAARSASAMRLRHPAQAVERTGDRGVTPLVGAHDPADGIAREARGPGVAEQHAPLQLVRELGVERDGTRPSRRDRER